MHWTFFWTLNVRLAVLLYSPVCNRWQYLLRPSMLPRILVSFIPAQTSIMRSRDTEDTDRCTLVIDDVASSQWSVRGHATSRNSNCVWAAASPPPRSLSPWPPSTKRERRANVHRILRNIVGKVPASPPNRAEKRMELPSQLSIILRPL